MNEIILSIIILVLLVLLALVIKRKKIAELKYKLIFDANTNLFFSTKDLIITDCNSKVRSDFGISRKNIIGKNILDFSPEIQPDGERSFNKIENILKDVHELGKVSFEWQFRLPKGRDIYMEITFELSGKKFGTLYGIIRNIDDRKRLESQIKQSQKLEVVGLLASGIAHDFNNILVSLMGNAELLSMKLGENSPLHKNVSMIREAANKARELIKKIGHFTNKDIVKSESLDIHETINSSIDLLEKGIDKKISIVKSYAASNFDVIGDSALLQSLLLNLGINAAEAMPGGGVLTITTINVELDSIFCASDPFKPKPGMFIEISVSDTGVGMTEDVLTQAFQPFYTTKAGESSGLGLSAVYGIVKDHKGLVKIYSEKDLGTVINIFLPVDPESAREIISQDNELFKGSGNVIIIDDEPLVLETARGQLTSLGFDVIAFNNALGGVEYYKNNMDDIAFLLLDMNMPEVNGYEAASMLKRINPHCKILFNSGFSKSFALKEFDDDSENNFIQKPFVLNTLSGEIKKIITL